MDITLTELAKNYQDEGEAYKFIEKLRWPHGPVCPHCGVIDHAYFLEPKKGPRKTRTGKVSHRRLWKCGDCRKQFSVLVGTIFEDSRIPLSKWILAFHLMCQSKNGISAHELHRSLQVTYRSAWFMAHRIRYSLAHSTFSYALKGTVEADETYVGGKITGRGTGRNYDNKVPVVTLVERGGEARSRALKKVTSNTIRDVLWSNVDPSASLMTDQSPVYQRPAWVFALHDTVDHHRDEWKRGNAHTNTVEGFFSQLKRSLDGTYHHVSEQHLHRYLAEFDYRYNTRHDNDGERTMAAIRKTTGKRLMYRDTKAKDA